MRILVIHAGGTIGMARQPEGFAPAAGIVEAEVDRLAVAGDLPCAVDVLTLDPLIDSANALPADWNRIAQGIADRRGAYAGIVVTHGTDTLAYTAAALCFALQGLDRPVIVTGAMLPLTVAGSDGPDNLRDALRAAKGGAPGVWVQFAGQLLHGARVWKTHSRRFAAFSASPASQPPLRPGPLQRHVFGAPKVALLPVAPGMADEVLTFALQNCDGVVLRCYGSGTVPETPALRRALQGAQTRGIPVIAVSQCAEGGIALGTYAAGHLLVESGVIDGRDMTAEAAYAKLILALAEADGPAARLLLDAPLCGEFA